MYSNMITKHPCTHSLAVTELNLFQKVIAKIIVIKKNAAALKIIVTSHVHLVEYVLKKKRLIGNSKVRYRNRNQFKINMMRSW